MDVARPTACSGAEGLNPGRGVLARSQKRPKSDSTLVWIFSTQLTKVNILLVPDSRMGLGCNAGLVKRGIT